MNLSEGKQRLKLLMYSVKEGEKKEVNPSSEPTGSTFRYTLLFLLMKPTFLWLHPAVDQT